MALTATLIRLDQATITRDRTGAVTIDDPDSPIVVTAMTSGATTPRQITDLRIVARHPDARITPAALARLPLAQIREIAAATSKHPNDAVWLSQIKPKPAGQRSWPADHWRTVLDVYQWATDTGRPGGGYQAVADMWNVSRDPTAHRWIARARRQANLTTTGPENQSGRPRAAGPARQQTRQEGNTNDHTSSNARKGT